jgi:hypothetical protein
MLRGEPKGQASPVPTGRPSSLLSALSEDQDPGRGRAARPTPGAHSPSPALRRSGTARAARACFAALRPARRCERRAGWTPGTAAHRSVLQAGFLEGSHSRTRARPQCSHPGLRLFSFPSFLRGQGLAMTPARRRDRGSRGRDAGGGGRAASQRVALRPCAAERPCRPGGRVPWGEGAALPRRPAQRGMLANGRRMAARAIVTRSAVRRCGAKKKGVFGRTKLTGRASAHPAYRSRRRAG